MSKRKIDVIVGKAETKTAAGDYARGYRKALRRRGLKWQGVTSVKRVPSGFVAIYYKPTSNKR